jgi:hypothetical protein
LAVASVMAAPGASLASLRPSGKDRDETVVVVPESASPVVELAARELQYYVEKATSVRMPIVTEGSVPGATSKRIYLGATRAALEAGLDPARLPGNAYRIRTAGDTSFLVGSDGDGDPLRLGTSAGTLFAVYDVLDEMGVRWLWPGSSGEFVPRRAAFAIRNRSETVLPRFRFSGLRTARPAERLWMRRMRMHGADDMQYGHAFGAWAEKYGAAHPDWFEMDAKGVRHQGRSMCVSNPGFQKQIVDNWWAEQQTHPGFRTIVNVCENDGPGACACPNCRAWDGPSPPWPRPTPYDNVPNVSQRYARFAMAVLNLAREHDPNAEVVAYAYSNMVFDPKGVALDKNVIMGYVPDVFFPRTAESQQWVLDQWAGWRSAGASLFLRPNYLLNGYCMPVNSSRQIAEEFQFFEKNGMIGTDYDSLTGMWSTMGLQLYTIGRLHVKPRVPVDQILDEYCSGFGPAAKQVREYWQYWERHGQEHIDVFKDGLWQYARYPETIDRRFPLESFGPAEAILSDAARAASTDPDAAIKVAFLRTGLTHARLCVEASIAFKKAGSDTEKQKAAVAKLLAFRKTITDPMVVNLSDGDSSCEALERNLEWPV